MTVLPPQGTKLVGVSPTYRIADVAQPGCGTVVKVMQDPQVSGWKPDFITADEQIRRQSGLMRSLVGSQVHEIWIVWNLELDRWFADLPVVLRIDGRPQLEVCWEKFDDLSITWNTIDLSLTPVAWVEWPLEWRQLANPPLLAVLGSPLTDLRATTCRFVTHDVAKPHPVIEVWLTAGLWFGTARGGLHVFNGLDENRLDSRTPRRDCDQDWHDI